MTTRTPLIPACIRNPRNRNNPKTAIGLSGTGDSPVGLSGMGDSPMGLSGMGDSPMSPGHAQICASEAQASRPCHLPRKFSAIDFSPIFNN